MGNVEDVRKALEEFVASSLVEVKTQVAGLHAELASLKTDSNADLTATEARLMKAIEAAKTEVLLMVRVSDLSARNAELEARLGLLSESRSASRGDSRVHRETTRSQSQSVRQNRPIRQHAENKSFPAPPS